MSDFGTFVGSVPIQKRAVPHTTTSHGELIPAKYQTNLTGKSLTPLSVTQPEHHPHTVTHASPPANQIIRDRAPKLSIKATWPFDLFPNKLDVDESKVVYYEHYFFFNDSVTTMLIRNIANCQVYKGIAGAELLLHDKYGSLIAMKWLKRDDAQSVKEYIEERMLAERDHGFAMQDDDASIQIQLTRYFEHLQISSS